MRYVLLLIVLCLSFVALNSVTKYRTPPGWKGEASNGSNLSASVPAQTATSGVTASSDENAADPIDPGAAASRDRNPPAEMAGAPSAGAMANARVLESPLALEADFLDMAPVPDAVAIQPSLSPFSLSEQATAYVQFIADSIRNSLMAPHGIQFGGIAGLNVSGAAAANATGKISGSPLSGFTLGAFADIPLKKTLSFRPEFLYSYEGYQPRAGGNRVNIHVAYLDVPLDIVYHTNLLSKRIYAGAGPYLAYALNGTYTMKGANTDMQFGNSYSAGDNLRNMDFGANLMAGILLDRNFILGATVNLGLSNIAPSGSTATDIHTRSIGLSIGYVFRNKANTKTD
jgi:hypothetical protein